MYIYKSRVVAIVLMYKDLYGNNFMLKEAPNNNESTHVANMCWMRRQTGIMQQV